MSITLSMFTKKMERTNDSPPPTSYKGATTQHHHHHHNTATRNQISPSMTLRKINASRQKSYPKPVGDTPSPLDTPGTFRPDETRTRKSYATILTSEAANNKVSPLGQEDNAWPPWNSKYKTTIPTKGPPL